mgnify:CR=1 FL=1
MKRHDAVAGGWGFAEAMLWFIIPDVYISYFGVRRGLRSALRLTAFAVAGAVVGGIVSYFWGALWPDAAQAAMVRLPGIDAAMIEQVSADVASNGSIALLEGPTRAQPYKLFAAAAGEHGTGLLPLMLWTIPGRAARFLIASLIAASLGSVGRRFFSDRVNVILWTLFWIAAYAVVWTR